MKKRWIAGMASVMLLTTAIMPVYAESPSQQSGELQIKTEVDSSYTLTIPQNTDIEFEKTSTQLSGALKVSGNVDTDEQVTVTATANPLSKASGETIDYALTDGTAAFTGAVWDEAELRAGLTNAEGQKAIDLYIEITEDEWSQAKAGSYAGTITFVASLDTDTAANP